MNFKLLQMSYSFGNQGLSSHSEETKRQDFSNSYGTTVVDTNMAARGAVIRDSASAMFGGVATNMVKVALRWVTARAYRSSVMNIKVHYSTLCARNYLKLFLTSVSGVVRGLLYGKKH